MTDAFDRRLNPYRYDSDGNLTAAARQQDSALHLDHVSQDGAGGPGGSTLVVRAPLLRTRADQCDDVAADFQRVCDEPLDETGDAGTGMKGFSCVGAFGDLTHRWKAQTRYVTVSMLGTFAADLRQSADEYEKNDRAAARSMHR